MSAGVAVVTGAAGQDGWFLTRRLLGEGFTVHAVVRRPVDPSLFHVHGDEARRLRIFVADLLHPEPIAHLIAAERPDEVYNLGGPSSVAESFAAPDEAFRANASCVLDLLEAIRVYSPETRFYQASSTEMFGVRMPDEPPLSETAPLRPRSPYAAAKAAAHVLCRTYRESYDLRVACGILSNHESHRRGSAFLSRKVVEHVTRLRDLDGTMGAGAPLIVGNLFIARDWGYAPQYVDGICRIARQIGIRGEEDNGRAYRDYVLGTGNPCTVWRLIDRAFALSGIELEWRLDAGDLARSRAYFKRNGYLAVVADERLVRPFDPLEITVDPSRARDELGWCADSNPDTFLKDMLSAEPPH